MTTSFILALDLLGSFAFAISGATVGVRRRLDLFGVMVLAFAAATAGGLVRDALIGALPPTAIADWRYVTVAGLAALLTFFRHGLVERLRNPVQLFDAIGLGLFAANGAGKALQYGAGPTGALLLGILSAVGGGIARDVLVAEVPAVLHRELYAVAAALGAGIVVLGNHLAAPAVPTALLGATACFLLRYVAMRRRWALPIAPADE